MKAKNALLLENAPLQDLAHKIRDVLFAMRHAGSSLAFEMEMLNLERLAEELERLEIESGA